MLPTIWRSLIPPASLTVLGPEASYNETSVISYHSARTPSVISYHSARTPSVISYHLARTPSVISYHSARTPSVISYHSARTRSTENLDLHLSRSRYRAIRSPRQNWLPNFVIFTCLKDYQEGDTKDRTPPLNTAMLQNKCDNLKSKGKEIHANIYEPTGLENRIQ